MRAETERTRPKTSFIENGRVMRLKRRAVSVAPPRDLPSEQQAVWLRLDSIMDTVDKYPSLAAGAYERRVIDVSQGLVRNGDLQSLGSANPQGLYPPAAIAVALFMGERRAQLKKKLDPGEIERILVVAPQVALARIASNK